MYQKNDGPRAGTMSRLYGEFARFYEQQRCPWAPANPKRIFNLAFDKLYPRFYDRLSEEQFLSAVYATLGFPGSDPKGMFETFDPAKYRGSRGLDDHFVSLFARKLTGKLTRAVSRTTDRGRRGDPAKFRPDPALGLLDERVRPESEQACLDLLPAVLACLDARERAVIHLTYWGDLSARKVGELLGMDHKGVARVHDRAVGKLRRMYGVEEKLAA
jgi:RNA polymerase sigma factor (sigma-70 family)